MTQIKTVEPQRSASLLTPARADPILCKAEVARQVGLSPATIDRMRARDKFPPALQLSPRRVGWRHSTIIAWLDRR